MEHICLADFVRKFKVCYTQKARHKNEESEDSDIDAEDEESTTFKCLGATIKKRKIYACIRYVRFQEIDDKENYFREIILLFYPWRDESQLIGNSETFTEQYRVLSKEFDIKSKMDEYNHKYPLLYQAILDAKNTTEEILEEQWNSYAPTRSEDKEVEDIGVGADVYPELCLPDLDVPDEESGKVEINTCDSLINYMKTDEYLHLIRSLNKQQEEFFLHILHHFKTSTEPIYQFLTGGAGVGKPVLVHAIYQALTRYFNSTPGTNPDEPKVLLAAPTGKAAHLIKGNTLHSLFKIPANQGYQYKPLVSVKLNTVRCKFKHVHLLIIDEISMVGNKMFSFIHQRLQQIKGSNKLFGGISILAVGDLFQLKPVFDGWVFENLSQEYGPLALNLWRENFRMYELNVIMRQTNSREFAELLDRLRECKHATADIQFLLQRKIPTDLMHPGYPILTPHI
jgi:DNA replication protein DnaC